MKQFAMAEWQAGGMVSRVLECGAMLPGAEACPGCFFRDL